MNKLDNAIIDRYDAPPVDALCGGRTCNDTNESTTSIKYVYGDYISQEVYKKISSFFSSSVKHIDFVFDVYLKQSRKRQTRESRGKNP